MSDFFTDLSGVYNTGLEGVANKTAVHNKNSRLGQELGMQDFLNLMVESLKNQSIDNTADLDSMMNQLVQMSVVTSINNISELITQSTNLSYAASLVGKEVTVAQRAGTQVQPITGTITGTGMVDGVQAIFIGDKSYWMSDILSVGRLPGDEAPSVNKAETAGRNGEATGAEDSRWDAVDAGYTDRTSEAGQAGERQNSAAVDVDSGAAAKEVIDADGTAAEKTAESSGASAKEAVDTNGTAAENAADSSGAAAEETVDASGTAEALEAASASVWTGRSGVVSIDESDSEEADLVKPTDGTSAV